MAFRPIRASSRFSKGSFLAASLLIAFLAAIIALAYSNSPHTLGAPGTKARAAFMAQCVAEQRFPGDCEDRWRWRVQP
jgi:hypothetical protein